MLDGHFQSLGLVALLLSALTLSPASAQEPLHPSHAPIEALTPSAIIRLTRGEQRVFRSGQRVHRVAVSDPNLCSAVQYASGEVGLTARATGTCDLMIWLADDALPPLHYVVHIRER